MDDRYRFAGVSLRITHDGGGLFSGIDREIRFYKEHGTADPDCTASFERKDGVSVPDKAVRTDVMGAQAVYLHEGRVYLVGKDKDYIIGMDFERKHLAVRYARESKALQNVSRWLLKWLIIKTAEGKGVSYVHASAAHYKGKNIIFCGDLIPFTLNTTIDEDLEKRFGIESSSFDIGSHMDHGERYGKADIVVFLRIWNSGKSEARPLERSKALLSLMKGYQKEVGFTPFSRDRNDPELQKRLFARYSTLLEDAECFEFFAGNDEEEVRKALIGFLDATS
jgi:hypothetical protein